MLVLVLRVQVFEDTQLPFSLRRAAFAKIAPRDAELIDAMNERLATEEVEHKKKLSKHFGPMDPVLTTQLTKFTKWSTGLLGSIGIRPDVEATGRARNAGSLVVGETKDAKDVQDKQAQATDKDGKETKARAKAERAKERALIESPANKQRRLDVQAQIDEIFELFVSKVFPPRVNCYHHDSNNAVRTAALHVIRAECLNDAQIRRVLALYESSYLMVTVRLSCFVLLLLSDLAPSFSFLSFVSLLSSSSSPLPTVFQCFYSLVFVFGFLQQPAGDGPEDSHGAGGLPGYRGPSAAVALLSPRAADAAGQERERVV